MGFLRRINSVFEPNYPERLKKSVMVPIPSFVVKVRPLLLLSPPAAVVVLSVRVSDCQPNAEDAGRGDAGQVRDGL